MMLYRLLSTAAFLLVVGEASNLTPVILVPGDGGSRIFARSHPSHLLCDLRPDKWSLIWLNSWLFLPGFEHCLGTYFRLYYNSSSRQAVDHPGLRTEVQDWGGLSSINYIGYLHLSFEKYFAPLSARLEAEGYVAGLNLRGAPFDFRQAPNGNAAFFPRLKALVEETFRRNNGSRVMLLGHSMGNLYLSYFLRHVDARWKRRFVAGFVAVSAPVGGAVKSLLAATAGIRFSRLILSMRPVAEVFRSIPSTYFNFPSPLLWRTDEVLVSRPGRNYTVADYRRLLLDVPNPPGWDMYQDTARLVDPRWSPDVDRLVCAHGFGLDTPQRLRWARDSDFPDAQPQVESGDGDGTVNLRSLAACHRWRGVKVLRYRRAKHKQILGDKRFLDDLMAILRR